jgi:two-component system nitrate/nitrite response regulator NarL
MSEKIRVLLVDDHTLFRSGIKSLLQRNDDFEVVGEAGDGLEGIKRARSLKPDVALLDLHMPGVSGLEAVKVIAEEMPEVRVLMLTVSEDAQDLMEALRAGASGYLLKNIETDALVDAIRRAAQGESVVSPADDRQADPGRAQSAQGRNGAVERDRFRRASAISSPRWPRARATRKSPASSIWPKVPSRSMCRTSSRS